MNDEFDQLDRLILERQVISSMILIREMFGCGLKEAIEFFAARYEKLRQTRPDEFTVSREEYGRGIYT